ncbi:MAG: right-handed parallel beta-helix repeat-containing protein [bacterium]
MRAIRIKSRHLLAGLVFVAACNSDLLFRTPIANRPATTANRESAADTSAGGADTLAIDDSLTFGVAAAPPSVKKITLTVPSTSLFSQGTVAIKATLLDSLGRVLTGPAVTWTTTNGVVATVAAGVVTGVTGGSANITATSAGISATVTMNVTALANLPKVYLNTVAPIAPGAGGVIINVPAGGDFQAALNSARPGDVIQLANGAKFVGNFILPDKKTASTNWIVIRPASVSGLPAEGARMIPSIAAAVRLPLIVSPNALGALATAPAAHHYRIIGLEVTMGSAVTSNTGLVRFGDDGANGQTTAASVPHDLVLDRSYVHGLSNANLRRAVALNSASSAVIDSYLSDCHDAGYDSQAIMGWNGPGPYKIVNNYLEGSGENIMFGGADPGIANQAPSDIEIRHNHLYKPMAWKGVWLVKNLFELKNAKRVLVEGNIFENNWQDGQAGTAISLKSSSDGACSWCGTQDVTFRLNIVRNVGGAIAVSGSPDNSFVDVHARRLTINDNLFTNINVSAPFLGGGYGLLVNDDPLDIAFIHNTMLSPTNTAVSFGGGGIATRLAVRANLMGGGTWGIKGSGVGAGTASFNAFTSAGSFLENVMIFPASGAFPSSNYYPATWLAVLFSNFTAGDFRLTALSPFKRLGYDARDPGANVESVNSATRGVIVP